MKKIIAAAAAFVLAGFAFAQSFSIDVGVKVEDELNIFDFKNGDFDDGVDYLLPYPGFGIDAFASIGLPIEGLAIQPEVGFHIHQTGYEPKNGDSDDTRMHYMTLDIPVLVTYKININDIFFIRPEVGPRFSFVLGKLYDKDWDEINMDVNRPFNVGIAAGVSFGFNVGPGAIIIDLRYNRDFTKIECEREFNILGEKWTVDWDIGSAQSIQIGVGYAFKIM